MPETMPVNTQLVVVGGGWIQPICKKLCASQLVKSSPNSRGEHENIFEVSPPSESNTKSRT